MIGQSGIYSSEAGEVAVEQAIDQNNPLPGVERLVDRQPWTVKPPAMVPRRIKRR